MVNYIVCSTQRSGSSYLCHLLRSTEDLGRPGELFGKGKASLESFASKYGLAANEAAVGKYVSEKWRSPKGVFGLKMHYHQYTEFCKNDELKKTFRDMKYLYIERKDTIMQAVSLYKARQAGTWSSNHRAKRDVSYSFEGILSCLHFLNEEKAKWESFFSTANVNVLRIDYQALEEDPSSQIFRVYEYLDLPIPINKFHEFEVGITKQRDVSSYEWADKFSQDFKKNFLF